MTLSMKQSKARNKGLPGVSVALPALATAVAMTLAASAGWAADAPTKPAAASAKPAVVAASPDPFAALMQSEIQLGKSEEENGNLRAAAYHYDMVSDLSTGAAKSDYSKKASALRAQAKITAEQAFKEGMAAYDKGQIGPAFRSLLRALA